MSVRLTWLCYNPDAVFTIYRSENPMIVQNLPTPLISNITGTTTYLDGTLNEYYYLVKSVYSNKTYYSGQVKTVKDVPGHFIVDINDNYLPSYGGAVNFTVQTE